jgi:hypothetical protein
VRATAYWRGGRADETRPHRETAILDLPLAIASHGYLLVHAAALIQLGGFLMRDQVRLRLLVMTGNVLYILYYYVHPAVPLWDAMFWSGTFFTANLGMVVVLLRDRRLHGLSDDTLRVFGAFGGMVPGDFRRLMRIAHLRTAHSPVTLTRLGVPPVRLYFVIDGALRIERRDRAFETATTGMFIAEIGFLLGTPASATVTLAPGGRYAEWDGEALRHLMERRPAVRHAIEQAFNRDLATKLARS